MKAECYRTGVKLENLKFEKTSYDVAWKNYNRISGVSFHDSLGSSPLSIALKYIVLKIPADINSELLPKSSQLMV